MKDALGHGSDALGQRMHQVIARGQNGAQRAAAHEWMGNGITRKPGSEIMYDRAMAAARALDKSRSDTAAQLANDPVARELHSGTSKSDPAPLTTAEIADLKTRLRARGFASVKKD
jgi:hypothetical protein